MERQQPGPRGVVRCFALSPGKLPFESRQYSSMGKLCTFVPIRGIWARQEAGYFCSFVPIIPAGTMAVEGPSNLPIMGLLGPSTRTGRQYAII
jgi:hypothetical protein